MVFDGQWLQKCKNDSDCKNAKTLTSKNVSQATPMGSLVAPLSQGTDCSHTHVLDIPVFLTSIQKCWCWWPGGSNTVIRITWCFQFKIANILPWYNESVPTSNSLLYLRRFEVTKSPNVHNEVATIIIVYTAAWFFIPNWHMSFVTGNMNVCTTIS